jgi:aromatic ring hydroxylase
MPAGAAYVESLRDGRAVFLDGERVPDVTGHPALAAAIRRVAETAAAALVDRCLAEY